VTLEGPGQSEQSGERQSHPDLLGFLSEFRAASASVSEGPDFGSPEAEVTGPVADPSGTDGPPSAVLSPSPGVPAPQLERDAPVRTWFPDSPGDQAPRWPNPGTGGEYQSIPMVRGSSDYAGPPIPAPVSTGPIGFPPAGPPRAAESYRSPPSPPGPTPQYGAPPSYGAPGPYSHIPPYGSPLPENRPGRGKIIGIIAACLVGLILIMVAIPTILGSRSGLHPAYTPAGYKAFTEKTDRFSLAVPGSWESVDPSSPGAAEAYQQMEANNPAFQGVGGGDVTNLASRGMKFLAVDGQSSVNVVVKPVLGAGSSSLSQLQSQLPGLYQTLGATLLSNQTLQLNGREALQATVEQPFNEPNGSYVVIDETQDFFAANDLVYSVTLAGTSPDLATIASTFNIGS
jgi:hypothetical protein